MVNELYDLKIFRGIVLVHEGGFEVLIRDGIGLYRLLFEEDVLVLVLVEEG